MIVTFNSIIWKWLISIAIWKHIKIFFLYLFLNVDTAPCLCKLRHWIRLWYKSSFFEFWVATSKTYIRTYAPSEDSDQPAHSRSLIRIFRKCILANQGCKVSSCGQRRLWLGCAGAQDYADAQADQSLRWAHTSEGTFSYVRLSYIFIFLNIAAAPSLCKLRLTLFGLYSMTSMARTRMARLPWMIWTRFSVPTKSFQ